MTTMPIHHTLGTDGCITGDFHVSTVTHRVSRWEQSPWEQSRAQVDMEKSWASWLVHDHLVHDHHVVDNSLQHDHCASYPFSPQHVLQEYYFKKRSNYSKSRPGIEPGNPPPEGGVIPFHQQPALTE